MFTTDITYMHSESILKCHWSGSKDLLYIPTYKAIRI